jgi:hypothetical protein
MHNVDGSFYDFSAARLDGTRQQVLTGPPDAWGGRAVVDWAQRLVRSRSYDPACEAHIPVSRTLDAIYAAAGDGNGRPPEPGPFLATQAR